MSQLSQIRTQVGQFTYHPDFTDIDQNESVPIIHFDQANLTSSDLLVSKKRTERLTNDKSFFDSINQTLQTDDYQNLMIIVNVSYYHFTKPSSRNLNFLRNLLRVYPKLTVNGSGSHARKKFREVKTEYLKFWKYVLLGDD